MNYYVDYNKNKVPQPITARIISGMRDGLSLLKGNYFIDGYGSLDKPVLEK